MSDTLLYGIAITALAISDLLLVVLGVVAYRLRREARDRRDGDRTGQALAALEALVRQDGERSRADNAALVERLDRQEARLLRLAERAPVRGGRQSFAAAARLAAQGAGVEDLVSACGLTRGEAELMRRLRGARAPEEPV